MPRLHIQVWRPGTERTASWVVRFKKRWCGKINYYSGAGTIFGQEGADRERQNRERKMKVFAGIGAFICPGNKRSPKKKGLRRIWSVFLSQKWLKIQVSGGAKVAQRGPKYFQRVQLPPYFRRRWTTTTTTSIKLILYCQGHVICSLWIG